MQVWSSVVCSLMSSRNSPVLLCFLGALYRTRHENGFSLDQSLDYQREYQPIHLPIDQREYQHIYQPIDQPPFRQPKLHRIILRTVLWRMYRPSCQLWVLIFCWCASDYAGRFACNSCILGVDYNVFNERDVMTHIIKTLFLIRHSNARTHLGTTTSVSANYPITNTIAHFQSSNPCAYYETPFNFKAYHC